MGTGNPGFLRIKRRDNFYVNKGDVTEIHAHHKDILLIGLFDTEDLAKIDLFTWSARYDKNTNSFYFHSSILMQKGKGVRDFIQMHRMLMCEPRGMVVDHFNNDTLDNRKDNLRIISNGQNSQNRKGSRKGSRSGIRGVSWRKDMEKWRVKVIVNYKHIHIGYYENLEEAEKSSIEARAKYMPYSKEALA